jgi:hypothetical protein
VVDAALDGAGFHRLVRPWVTASKSWTRPWAKEDRPGGRGDAGLADPLREILAGKVGDHGRERADVPVGSLQFGAAVSRAWIWGRSLPVRESGCRVSQSVSCRTVGGWCYRPRYLHIRRLKYLSTIRDGFAGVVVRNVTARPSRAHAYPPIWVSG